MQAFSYQFNGQTAVSHPCDDFRKYLEGTSGCLADSEMLCARTDFASVLLSYRLVHDCRCIQSRPEWKRHHCELPISRLPQVAVQTLRLLLCRAGLEVGSPNRTSLIELACSCHLHTYTLSADKASCREVPLPHDHRCATIFFANVNFL